MKREFKIPLGNQRIVHAVEDLIDLGYDVESVDLKKLIQDNGLGKPGELDYHREIWQGDPEGWEFDPEKVRDWLYSDCIYGVRKADGRILLSNGKHRCLALYNSGYDSIEMPVLDEAKSDPFEMAW